VCVITQLEVRERVEDGKHNAPCMLKLAYGTQHEKSSACATATLIKREITPCYAYGHHIRVLVGGRQRRQGVVRELLTLHHLLSRWVESVDGAFGRPDHSRQS
jgi:hypothetical protein